MKRSLGLLVAGCVAFWLVVAVPARLLGGDAAVLESAVAALLCFLPTAAILVWCQRALGSQPEQLLLAVLGGTAVRLGFVVVAGMALYLLWPEFHSPRFWLWVLAFYLVSLGLEVAILLRRLAAQDRSRHAQKGNYQEKTSCGGIAQ